MVMMIIIIIDRYLMRKLFICGSASRPYMNVPVPNLIKLLLLLLLILLFCIV